MESLNYLALGLSNYHSNIWTKHETVKTRRTDYHILYPQLI